ncbi:hypothetical protein RH915_10440 [Serpentinicella sp. ANB-PHB4]|uniref:hypothetical protein n=1 Tax=Serpentinicella sp. ANB-PHB4 TaxID=3074076 RepID=UPI0028566E55|nr:hypothetical protein [Serpentinicella sp. ANB-PHB4]MDR5659906.1 hypothetical protein [Serpentinicella sp. ANB-PHB4]
MATTGAFAAGIDLFGRLKGVTKTSAVTISSRFLRRTAVVGAALNVLDGINDFNRGKRRRGAGKILAGGAMAVGLVAGAVTAPVWAPYAVAGGAVVGTGIATYDAIQAWRRRRRG